MASSFWNSHEITWNGRDSATLIDEDIINRRVLDTRTTDNSNTKNIHYNNNSEILEIPLGKHLKRQV